MRYNQENHGVDTPRAFANKGFCKLAKPDPALPDDALECAARLPRMLGLIVTSGLEPLAMELSRAPRVPRFIGNGAQALAVRDPRRFFALLSPRSGCLRERGWQARADRSRGSRARR